MANVPQTKAMQKKYAAETDLHCLIGAEKIKKDKTRFAAAMAVHKAKIAELGSLAAANPKAKEGSTKGNATSMGGSARAKPPGKADSRGR